MIHGPVKPSTLALPSPDQAISARWITHRIRQAFVEIAPGQKITKASRAYWRAYNMALTHLGQAVQRRARTQAATAFRKAAKCRKRKK